MTSALLSARTARPARAGEHIVDVLIAERAPKLTASPAWPVLRPLLYSLLDYRKARRMADALAPMRGRAALAHASALLGLKVEASGLERVPAAGPLMVVANHPTGIADGVAVYDALQRVRPDLVFYANADAHRVCPGFDEVLIPVEWVEAKRTRARTRLTLTRTQAVLEAGRALVVFPAGRIARRGSDGRLRDPAWQASAVSVARKAGAPILPVHVAGPNSALFHLFHRVSQELRDITLFHELLNKRGRRYRIAVGALRDPAALSGDASEAIAALKRYVEDELPQEADAKDADAASRRLGR